MLDLLPLFAMWKNSLASVNRLPPEVLTRVARFLSHDDLYAGLRVCRYWYNVLMTPELWSDIDLDRVNAATVFLSRSGGVPVDVKITRWPQAAWQYFILSNCSSRIQSLDVSSSAVCKRLLNHFIHHQAPLLRSLRISHGRDSPVYHQLPSRFFTGHLPSLRTLSLTNISSDLTHFVLPNLTTFELESVTDSNATLSLFSLLGFLERSPRLERLHIVYHSQYDDKLIEERVVTLPHMKNVFIGGNPLTPTDTSHGLLAHLSLPPGVVVEVTIYVRGHDTDVVSLVVPSHHDLIPCTKSIKKIWFQRPSGNTCVMRFSGDNGVLNIFASWPGIYRGLAARAICSFGSLDVSGVETLIVGSCGNTHEYFAQALGTLTNLRSIILSHCDNGSLLNALHREGTSPRLRDLAIDFSHPRRADVTSLVEMARVRELRGQKLETLKLALSNIVGDTSVLREHVGSLEEIGDVRIGW